MKINKKILALTIIPFLFISCEDEKVNGLKIGKVEVEKMKKIEFQDFKEKVIFDKATNTLKIGKSVVIKKGGKNLPNYIKTYNNEDIYVNSNVKNYVFFIADKEKEVNDIGKYYISMFEEMGFTRILQEVDETINDKEIIENFSNLELVLKNDKYKLGENGFPIGGEKEFLERILINIHSETPKNIKNGMGLEGRHVEIYYKQN